MKRRLWAAVLVFLMVCQLTLPAEGTEEKVYFTAAEESVLPLKDSTMPFWSGGYLYLPSTMFTDNVWRSLGISYVKNNRGKVILHNAGQAAGQSLLFEPGAGYTMDSNGGRHTPGAVSRGGIAFVPAALVASFFGLQYSVTEVPRGYLVWLRKPGFGLSASAFADAATYNMETAYASYRKSLVKEQIKEEVKPIQPELLPQLPEEKEPGAGIFLCLEAGDETATMLEVLRNAGSYAAFFCTPEFLSSHGALLRRMTASGHRIGLLVRGGKPLEEQLQRANDLLEQEISAKTRLVYIEGGTAGERQKAAELGYAALNPDLNQTGRKLKSVSDASRLMTQIASHRDRVTVWLGNSANAFGLRHFLAAADREENRCFALTELAV